MLASLAQGCVLTTHDSCRRFYSFGNERGVGIRTKHPARAKEEPIQSKVFPNPKLECLEGRFGRWRIGVVRRMIV